MNQTWKIKHGSMAPEEADLSPMYWHNPYWTVYKNYNTGCHNCIIVAISLNYAISDWLSLIGRKSVDKFKELREERRAIERMPIEFETE